MEYRYINSSVWVVLSVIQGVYYGSFCQGDKLSDSVSDHSAE